MLVISLLTIAMLHQILLLALAMQCALPTRDETNRWKPCWVSAAS
jgi:hypothetical protein